MALLEEGFEKFKRDFLQQQEKSRINNQIHDEISRLYKSNALPAISPLWHNNASVIDLNQQRDNKNIEELTTLPFSVLNDVDFEVLLNNMTQDCPSICKANKLYHPSLDDYKISAIVNHWINGEPLIPPTIAIYNEEYIRIAQRVGVEPIENKLVVIDGYHRLNTAYYFKAPLISILVYDFQLDKVQRLLGI
ncbi:MAG TPA: hypothetical protein VD794_13135 [Flavisolibacter sp.]|nr:hypothetical protein [Flavisolibacter sp.]